MSIQILSERIGLWTGSLLFLLGFSQVLALEAEFETSEGTFTVQLSLDSAPLAVSHFVLLAEDQLQWLDTESGRVIKGGYYENRVVTEFGPNDDVSFFVVGGSDASGDSDLGYVFPDQLSPQETHSPYTLALSNSGPNTNGGRVYLTGNDNLTERDESHTVLGHVQSGGGRDVVDRILSSSAGATTVHSVEVTSTSAEWAMIMEQKALLPAVASAVPSVRVTAAGDFDFGFTQPKNSVLWGSSSLDLLEWHPRWRRAILKDDLGLALAPVEALAEREFFRLALVEYPAGASDLGVTSFANRTLSVEGEALGFLHYHFDSTGLSGDFELFLDPDFPAFLTGDFVVEEGLMSSTPYSVSLLLAAEGLGGSSEQRVSLGWDISEGSGLSGRHVTDLIDENGEVIFSDFGPSRLQ
ncbi:peptidylprolyl isomerase [Roseibacillus persicicus]|uniref:peptidylprolyl isomerase n=1 Tax=Roseibacillus persicicus TaxID=454148 RepID=UPI00280CDC3C|nr:peptidylprolyl isomerase [Roseibacillus persicicus]MDQ8191592.1 peptidylprolyl isomerase [Roseibacillus persicicus]